MSSGGHAYPIYSLDVVGTQNAHNIVSLSNDGQVNYIYLKYFLVMCMVHGYA
jgi:hypothetical protein